MDIKADHLPRRRIGVENLLARTKSTLNSFASEGEYSDSLFARLRDIQAKVLEKERQFYEDLNLNPKNPEFALEIFQESLDVFLSNPLTKALSSGGRVMQEIESKYYFSLETRTDQELIEQLTSVISNEEWEDLLKNSEDMALQGFIQELNKDTRKLGHNFRLTNKVGAKFTDTSLTAAIRVYIRHRKNKITSSIIYEGDSDKILSKKMRSTLKKVLDNYNKTQDEEEKKIKKSIMEISKETLIDEIIQSCQEVNDGLIISQGELSNLIKTKASTGEIFINRSKSAIIGFLGELQAGLFLSSLGIKNDSKAANVVYTGAMRYIEGRTGQEIITDIAVKGYGFQIKSYIKSSNFTVSGTLQGNNFINNRFRISDESLKQAFINLFGVYQYNRPFPTEGRSEESQSSINAYQTEVYDTIEPIFKTTKPILDTYIDNALGISDEVSKSDLTFMNEKIYFNTFFLISGKIVPASKILYGIINKLKQAEKTFITTSYSISLKDTTAYTLYNYLNKNKGSGLTAEESAAQMLVSYSITLYLDEILSVPLE